MTTLQRGFGMAVVCIAAVSFPMAAIAQQSQAPVEGICVLMPTEGNHVTGTISLLEEGDALHLAGEVRHLTPGLHGFHIHEFGDLRAPDASTCGGHYNPTHQSHEGLNSAHRHLGDLGNIEADSKGIALVDIKVPGLKINSIIGRSLVVHAKKDDLHTQPSGDSGARVAAGVIGFRQMP